MLTAHERHTASGILIHLPRCRALAREADVRLVAAAAPRQVLLPLPSPALLPSKTRVRSARIPRFSDPFSSKATWRILKSHR